MFFLVNLLNRTGQEVRYTAAEAGGSRSLPPEAYGKQGKHVQRPHGDVVRVPASPGRAEEDLKRHIKDLEAQLLALKETAQVAVHTPPDREPEGVLSHVPPVQQHKRWFDDINDIPPGSTVWVTFVNGDEKYRDLMINWAYHLRAVNVPHVVVAFDDVAASVCRDKGIPFLRCEYAQLAAVKTSLR